MSTPPLFKDLGKRSSDLLTKEYPSEEKKFEWKGTTSNGVTIETNAVQKGDGPIVGTITPSYKYKEYGLNVLGEFNTNKDIKLETSVENQGVQGLKATLTGEQKGKDTFATLAAEYKHQHATVNGSVDFGKSKGNTIKANSVFGHIGWLFRFICRIFDCIRSPRIEVIQHHSWIHKQGLRCYSFWTYCWNREGRQERSWRYLFPQR